MSTKPPEVIKHCPNCGTPLVVNGDIIPWHCTASHASLVRCVAIGKPWAQKKEAERRPAFR